MTKLPFNLCRISELELGQSHKVFERASAISVKKFAILPDHGADVHCV